MRGEGRKKIDMEFKNILLGAVMHVMCLNEKNMQPVCESFLILYASAVVHIYRGHSKNSYA